MVLCVKSCNRTHMKLLAVVLFIIREEPGQDTKVALANCIFTLLHLNSGLRRLVWNCISLMHIQSAVFKHIHEHWRLDLPVLLCSTVFIHIRHMNGIGLVFPSTAILINSLSQCGCFPLVLDVLVATVTNVGWCKHCILITLAWYLEQNILKKSTLLVNAIYPHHNNCGCCIVFYIAVFFFFFFSRYIAVYCVIRATSWKINNNKYLI